MDERFERHEAVRALHAQLRIDFISVELTTARTMAGIVKTEVRHSDLPHAREALNQARRVRGRVRSQHPLNDNESALLDPQFRGSRGHVDAGIA